MKTEEIKTWRDRITTPTTNQKNLFMSMQAEINELREAFANLHSDYDIIEIDRDELKAKLAALEAQDTRLKAELNDAMATIELVAAAGAAPVPRMTGAALASQEPVAEVLLVDGEKVIDASMAFFDSVELGTKLYLAAGAAPVPNAELAEALEDLMSWQVKNVKRWHNAAYDNAARVLKKLDAGAAPAAKVPEEPRIDINDLSGMIAAVIKEQP